MNRIKNVLRDSSEFRSHNSNMAKEYVLFDDDTFLTLGIDCMYVNDNLYVVDKTDNKLSLNLVKERSTYILCYGVSLTNTITLLQNKDVKIISINKYKEDNYTPSFYIITTKREYKEPETFKFIETQSLHEFEESALGDHICRLYNY